MQTSLFSGSCITRYSLWETSCRIDLVNQVTLALRLNKT
jgi:hypothetical protein